MVPQYGAGPSGPRTASRCSLPAALGGVVTDLATFDRTAPSFDNPDFVPVVIHSYRHRHGNAPGDPRFDAIERHLATRPPIQVPTVVLHGADDGVSPPYRSEAHMALFPAGTARHVVAGAGHFLPREKPQAVFDALLTLLRPAP